MLLKNSPDTAVAFRNCHRCGDEFRTDENERVCKNCRKPRPRGAEPLRRHLTLREKQIVDLVRQAKLNKEIAHMLHLSEGTVKEYLNKIFRKLDVKNRTDLAIWSFTHPAECQLIPAASAPSLHESATVQ
jgi:DNA-binding NarL/FixJ family response regulator